MMIWNLYFEAKKLLFTDFDPKIALTNLDDDYGARLKDYATVCTGQGTEYYFDNEQIIYFDGYKIDTQSLEIKGHFQYQNLCMAVILAVKSGLNIENIIHILPKIHSAEGRLQQVSKNPNVVVDFAHKPEAMRKVLNCLRVNCKGKLITVFGCGGDRDKQKRPIMGKIANQYSDVVIVTDDNPRYEDPILVREEICITCPKAINIGSRKEAIIKALEIADKNDTVAILGKGNEKYQKIKDQELPLDDVDVVRQALVHNN